MRWRWWNTDESSTNQFLSPFVGHWNDTQTQASSCSTVFLVSKWFLSAAIRLWNHICIETSLSEFTIKSTIIGMVHFNSIFLMLAEITSNQITQFCFYLMESCDPGSASWANRWLYIRADIASGAILRLWTEPVKDGSSAISWLLGVEAVSSPLFSPLGAVHSVRFCLPSGISAN